MINNRLNKLIIGEIVGPWAFGVLMFSSILYSMYLTRIAEYVTQGVSSQLIMKLAILWFIPVFIKTFAMAMLLGSLLAFGRLSGDSEIVALRASGASLPRILAPVAVFALGVSLLTYALNDTIVPRAAKEGVGIMSGLAKDITAKSAKPTFQTIVKDGRLQALVMAQDFNLGKGVLSGVTVKVVDEKLEPLYYLEAPELKFVNEREWKITKGGKIFSADLTQQTTLKSEVESWPADIPLIKKTPSQFAILDVKDPEFFTAQELREQLSESKTNKSLDVSQYRNREYWLWLKYSIPCAAFVFGLLGAALGIRSHRAGTATGFALAVGIMFLYMTLSNFMNSWAMEGALPPFAAAFTPVILGLAATGIIIYRRNQA